MTPSPDPTLLEADAVALLKQAGSDPSYARVVVRCAMDLRDQWRVCCGSGCEPCVEEIYRHVAALREKFDLSS